MTENEITVEKYMDGFTKSDHELVLSCLTDDIEWEMPGAFHLIGKEAFSKEIENDAFIGSPTINITRMTEENDVVVAVRLDSQLEEDRRRLKRSVLRCIRYAARQN